MLRKRISPTVLIVAALVLSRRAAEAQEFDFGVEEQREDQPGVSLPIRGKLTLEAAHSAGESARWHKAGPAANFVADWNGGVGSIFGEATLRYNGAYRLAGDPESVVDARGLEAVVREVYWKKSFDRWSVSAGNAIVVWGEGDILTSSDVVSRRDGSQLLFEYPATSRLGQNLVQLGFFPTSRDQIDLLVVPRALGDRLPPAAHPDAMFGPAPVVNASTGAETELGAQWRRRFARGEMAIHGGYFHERRGLFREGGSSVEKLTPGFAFVGISGHRAFGPIVWRGELSLHKARAHQRWSTAGPAGYVRRDLVSGLIAADLVSSHIGRISLELGLASGIPYAFDGLDRGLRPSVAASWLKRFLHDELGAQASVIFQDGVRNLLARGELGYRLDDSWEMVGKVTFLNEGLLWGPFGRQARVEFDLSYSFDLSGGER